MTIELSRSMLTTEENIQQHLNQAGNIATAEALKYLDTDGSQIELAGEKMYCKAKQNKAYQTPYGKVNVQRHIYQRAGGGKTYCPMEGHQTGDFWRIIPVNRFSIFIMLQVI